MLETFKRYRDSLSYDRIIFLAVSQKDPFKTINFVGITIGYFLKLKKIPFLPINIDIEPNNNCNLMCHHCQVSHWHKNVVHLDIESYKYILDQFPNLLSVKLQGMGEPFINKRLLDMMKEGERRGISIQITSNGTIYNKLISDQLVQLKKSYICFSIDGATSETHETIRKGSKFDVILDNIQDLIKRRGLNQYPRISIWAVITNQNIHEIQEIVKLAKTLNVDFINIQSSLTSWGKKNIDEYNKTIRIKKSSKLDDILSETKEVAKSNKIKLNIHGTIGYSIKKPCHWPWMSTYIAANGDIIPCCILADSDTFKIGNIFEENFSEIWNSKKYQDLRGCIRSHDIPEFCRGCYVD